MHGLDRSIGVLPREHTERGPKRVVIDGVGNTPANANADPSELDPPA